MLLAKIKGNKVHFGKLVTFLGGGGVCLRPTDPLDPLEGVLGGHLLENFPIYPLMDIYDPSSKSGLMVMIL